ncbi:DUF2490 domain-containing protein [Flavobacteriales bacterium]|jgi:hypothetical protein|nr:DUF2490 domain-containing protein [Flavobacteriales bacterium]MDB9931655.1 DUF2490 domain-containing protein [Flavobacteriales bacterium]|tara:strand:- start:6446 stop:7168 length:723 start_codon:yes stop_codon:yes gene_type:complete
MNKTYKSILSVVIFSAIFSSSFSQNQTEIEVRDLETWTSAGVTMKLNKDWKFTLSEQLRLKTNSTIVDNYFTELEAKYSGLKGFELGVGLRYIKNNDNQGKIQGYESHFRYNLDLGYKHKLGDFKMGYRVRFQNKNELGVSELEGDEAINKLRIKLGTEYNIKGWKLDPKASVEMFNVLGTGFDKLRLTVGTSYGLKKYGDISLFYRMERELMPTYVDYPKTTNIIGLNYTYTFKIKTND